LNFSIQKNTLQNVLLEHSKVVPLRTTLPILSCVVLIIKEKKLTLKTTDLEQTIISNTKIENSKQGEVAIPLAKFLEIVSAISEETIKISVDSNFLIEINSKQGTYRITGRETTEFPETPKLQQEQQIKIKGNELLDIINNTLYAVSKDDLKPALCGIYLKIKEKTLMAVATDGHRLVKYKKELNETNPESSIIVPGRFFSILKNNIKTTNTIKINLSENHVEVTEQKTTTITRIIKENFPDFNSVIPEQGNTKATIKSEKLIEAIKRVSIFSNKTTKQITLSFNDNEVLVSTEDKETNSSAKEHLVCEYQKDTQTIAYNAQYLKEVIQHIDSQEVEVFLSGPLTAAVFKPKNQQETTTLTALLMPLRTKN